MKVCVVLLLVLVATASAAPNELQKRLLLDEIIGKLKDYVKSHPGDAKTVCKIGCESIAGSFSSWCDIGCNIVVSEINS